MKSILKDVRAVLTLPVLVVALGYFVDIFDLTLFSMLRMQSLKDLHVQESDMIPVGIRLLNAQMLGMLLGGLLWGILADKKGRIKVLFGSILLYSLANILNAFVTDVHQYEILRFISGIGLAGELGAGITLIAEILPTEKRGLGTTLVAAIGVAGAVFGGVFVEFFSWRICFIIGGILGLLLLFLRYELHESDIFQNKNTSTDKTKGNLLFIFKSGQRIKKFIFCIFLGVPIWYVVGLLMSFSPELSQQLGVVDTITSSRAIAVCYLGLAVGDFLSGVVSQMLASRMKSVQMFILSAVVFILALFFTTKDASSSYYYFLCFLIGAAVGFWAMFVTISAEQFGTNIRATMATSIPNFVRGSVVLMTLSFQWLKNQFSFEHALLIIGAIVFTLALVSTFLLEETFHKRMDYLED